MNTPEVGVVSAEFSQLNIGRIDMAARSFCVVFFAIVGLAIANDSCAEEPNSSQDAVFLQAFESAKQLVAQGKLVEGIKAFRRLPDPAHPLVQLELADAYAALGENDIAITAYSRVIVAPQLASILAERVHLMRGQLYLKSGRIREAIQDFREGTQLNPINSEMQLFKGRALLDLARRRDPNDLSRTSLVEQAVKSFDTALRFDEALALAYYERGMAKAILGQSSAAQEDLSHAMSLGGSEFTLRLVDLNVELQSRNEGLRRELSSFKERAQRQEKTDPLTSAREMADTLREIRDLLRVQTARR